MIETTSIEQEKHDVSEEMLSSAELKYLKFGRIHNEYVVTLVDEGGYEILRGYGQTTIEAINDMHNNLI